ncbi:hypothetical protein KFU94_35290 [Chloroflexi bacterium TSY]|nr:hypothetical protein [Chloroflexi bacterium TSY]
MDNFGVSRWEIARQLAISYTFWLITCAIGVLNFITLRPAIRSFAVVLGADRWTLPAIERFSIIFMGIGVLVFILWYENRYRTEMRRGFRHLLRLFGRVTGWQLVLLIVSAAFVLIPLYF